MWWLLKHVNIRLQASALRPDGPAGTRCTLGHVFEKLLGQLIKNNQVDVPWSTLKQCRLWRNHWTWMFGQQHVSHSLAALWGKCLVHFQNSTSTILRNVSHRRVTFASNKAITSSEKMVSKRPELAMFFPANRDCRQMCLNTGCLFKKIQNVASFPQY